MRSSNPHTRAGFTLIELLVVISIIGMLSSVVLAALQGARDKGRVSSILTFATYNYHKIGADMIFYANFNEASGAPTDQMQNFTTAVSIGRGNSFTTGSAFDALNQVAPLEFTPVKSLTTANKNYSFSVWVNRSNAAVVGWESILVTDGNDSGRQIYQNANDTNCWQSTGVTVPNIRVNDGIWHNIFCSFNSSAGQMSLYFDGKLIATGAMTNNTLTFTTMRIGNYFSGASKFKGLIDEVQVYNESLTAMQIRNIYAEGLKTHPLARQ